MGIHFSDHCGVTHTNNHRVATQEYFHWTLKEWWRDQSLGEKFAKGAQDPGLRITTLVQFCKLLSHWRMNDGSNLSSHWSKNVWF